MLTLGQALIKAAWWTDGAAGTQTAWGHYLNSFLLFGFVSQDTQMYDKHLTVQVSQTGVSEFLPRPPAGDTCSVLRPSPPHAGGAAHVRFSSDELGERPGQREQVAAPHAGVLQRPGSGWLVPARRSSAGGSLPPWTMRPEGSSGSTSHGLPSAAGRLAGPLTSRATAAIKLISFLIYTRLSLGELWADLIKVCKWCAYAISFNPLMPSCQNKILKKGFEGIHMGIMAFQKRALSTW